MRPRWLTTSSLVLLLLATGAAVVQAQPAAEAPAREEQLGEDGLLRRAIALYDAGQYEGCVDAFHQMLDPEEPGRLRSPSKVEAAMVYYGSCLIGVGRTLEAEAIFRQAILDNPQMKTPDSLLFPDAVVELFLRVRESMMDEIRRAEQKRMQQAEDRASREITLRQREQARVAQLLTLAETETVVERRSRWLTLVPFGTGQFQNGNRGLGWFFLGSELAATATFVTSMYLSAWYNKKAGDDGNTRQQILDYGAAQDDAYLVSTISGWGLVGLVTAGLVESNLAFVPESTRTRPRPLPEELRQLTPAKSKGPTLSFSVSPSSNGGWTGSVTGRF